MTRNEFVCAALLKYMERREVMDTLADLYAEKEKLADILEAVLQFARCYTLIEECCERAADEMEYKKRLFDEAHAQDFPGGRRDLN